MNKKFFALVILCLLGSGVQAWGMEKKEQNISKDEDDLKAEIIKLCSLENSYGYAYNDKEEYQKDLVRCQEVTRNHCLEFVKKKYGLMAPQDEQTIVNVKMYKPCFFDEVGLLDDRDNVQRFLEIIREKLIDDSDGNFCGFDFDFLQARKILVLERMYKDEHERQKYVKEKKYKFFIKKICAPSRFKEFKKYFQQKSTTDHDCKDHEWGSVFFYLIVKCYPGFPIANKLEHMLKLGVNPNLLMNSWPNKKFYFDWTPLEIICDRDVPAFYQGDNEAVSLANLLLGYKANVTLRCLELSRELRHLSSGLAPVLEKAYEQQQKSLKEVTSKKCELVEIDKN